MTALAKRLAELAQEFRDAQGQPTQVTNDIVAEWQDVAWQNEDAILAALENAESNAAMLARQCDLAREAETRAEGAREKGIRDAAEAVRNVYGGRAHTYASENADTYRVQDGTIASCVKACLALLPAAGKVP